MDLFSSQAKRTYVIPDIHGRYDLLLSALDLILRREAGRTQSHRIVFTGDYIDRGPQSRQVVEHLRQGQMRGEPWILLMGNHEEMMILVDDGRIPAQGWLNVGGFDCMKSYEGHADMLLQHTAFLRALPSVYQDEHRIYVHACVDEAKALAKQEPQVLRWGYFTGDTGFHGKHVVHGHDRTSGKPKLLKNRTNLDCGAVKNGKLVFGMFEDDRPGGPVALLDVDARSRRGKTG